jgi:hypothetical protein
MFYIRAVSLRLVVVAQAPVRLSWPQVRKVTRKPYGQRIPLPSCVASNCSSSTQLARARCRIERQELPYWVEFGEARTA